MKIVRVCIHYCIFFHMQENSQLEVTFKQSRYESSAEKNVLDFKRLMISILKKKKKKLTKNQCEFWYGLIWCFVILMRGYVIDNRRIYLSVKLKTWTVTTHRNDDVKIQIRKLKDLFIE